MEPDRSADANVGSWLSVRAARHPERVAVHSEDRGTRVTYAALDALANRSAHALLDAGVGVGDRVALALPSEPLYLALYFAAARIGAILLPLNTRLAAPELAFQLDDAEPRLVIHDSSHPVPDRAGTQRVEAEAFRAELPADTEPPPLAPGGEAPQVLMYTSGTTGRPKGALLPHRKTVFNTLNAEIFFGLGEQDVVVVPVPLFHSYGLKILSVPSLFAGATVVLVERFDPVTIQDCVAHHAASIHGGVPVMYRRMVQAGLRPEALASLRFAFSAGAPCDVATIRAFNAAGVALKQGYGQTETSLLCCLDAADCVRKAGSVGRPVRHGEIRIADAQGREVARGERGEVVVRGPIVMLGYWRRPVDTRAARLDGWHRTGDLGTMDPEGFVTLVGRLVDLYISGGENVYPAEVERVLEEHPSVAEAAVVGRPDPEWGETGHAYVVPAVADFDPEGLARYAATRLARYKLPRHIVVVDELPRTPAGKVQKGLLGERRR